jgi:flagellar secretion chaperone FliS
MHSPAPKLNPYLRTKVLTASREELRLLLFDGAIKFARQAKGGIEQNDHEKAYENVIRAQKIVLELSSSLNHEMMPDVCEKLSALYTYIYRLLVDATMERKTACIDEAVKLLQYERDTWVMLMKSLGQDPSGEAAAPPAQAGPAANPYASSPSPAAGTYSRSA